MRILPNEASILLWHPQKMDEPEQTNGQVELGYRFYEGSAAGALMIGQMPKSETLRKMFDWPDAVIEIQPDGSDVGDILANLATEPERVATISQANARESLLRHD